MIRWRDYPKPFIGDIFSTYSCMPDNDYFLVDLRRKADDLRRLALVRAGGSHCSLSLDVETSKRHGWE